MRSDTTPAGERDHGAIWRETCDRVVDLVSSVPEVSASQSIPTLPSATLRDVVRHLIEVAEVIANGGAAGGTALVLPSSSGSSSEPLADLVATWQKTCDSIGARVDGDAELAAILITDTSMCEHDIRTALDRPAARDDISIKVALDELSGRFSDRVVAAHIPPLRVTVEQWGTIIGDGHAVRCVVADRFEFVRGMSGRRSASEVGRWNWGTEPAEYVDVLGETPLPIKEIHERDPRVPEHMRDREFVLGP